MVDLVLTQPQVDPQRIVLVGRSFGRYNCIEQAPKILCPSFITDNETDVVSTGQGKQLFDALTSPKTFRRFLRNEGAEGHCEGMAPIVFWTAAFDWLEETIEAPNKATTRD